MRFHKYFLRSFLILLLTFNQQTKAMEDELSPSFLRAKNISEDLPIETQVHFLSFLQDQNDLLKVLSHVLRRGSIGIKVSFKRGSQNVYHLCKIAPPL